MVEYRTTYTDARGSFPVSIANDGETLGMRIRGIDFEGWGFDELQPPQDTSQELLEGFTFFHGSLGQCRIDVEMPIRLLVDGAEADGLLTVCIELYDTNGGGFLEPKLRMRLTGNGLDLASVGTGWSFEDELLDLGRKLRPARGIKSCLFCQYSGYSPYGWGSFGTMMCFRNLKSAYVATTNKHELFELPPHDPVERVQETWLCSEFAPRVIAAGYRGGI